MILREPKVMGVTLSEVPQDVTVINLRKIGRFSGIRDGRWLKSCDYLLVHRASGKDKAVFVELKRTIADTSRGMEQLRRSLPYLDYLRSVCRLEYEPSSPSGRVRILYVLIATRVNPMLDKRRVYQGHTLPRGRCHDIDVRRFVGKKLRFDWLVQR